jgi:uncharacterized membrane protein
LVLTAAIRSSDPARRSRGDGDLVFAAYVTVTLVTSALVGLAAIGNFTGHPYVKAQADANRVPYSWSLPLGALLAAGAVGLLAGLAVPLLGTLAATGLVLYFVGAFAAHLRARNYKFGPWAMYFALAVATLVLNVAHSTT